MKRNRVLVRRPRDMTLALLALIALSIVFGLAPASASSYSIVAGGSPVVVTTTAAGENATVTFGGTAGQRVSLKVSADSISLAHLSISKPDATSLLAPTQMTRAGGLIDTLTLPATGTYTILVDPASSYVGSMTLTLYNVPPDISTTITPGGAAVTSTITTPGQNAALTFNGTAGQRISLKVASTITLAKLSILNPDNSSLVSPTQMTTAPGYIDATVLPATGTYTIVLDPTNAYTGAMALTLYNVPSDVATTITPGGAAVTATITTPGQNAALTFNGTAGQRISLKVASTITQTKLSILNPDTSTLVAPMTVITSGTYIDATPLPATGTYTIVLDPASTYTGSVTLTLYNVPPDISTTITPGGAAVTSTIATPGQNAALTFNGTAGQHVSLKVVSTITQAKLSILDPSSANLVTPLQVTKAGGYIDTTELPATGTYTILLDPAGTNTGAMTLTLYDVPPDFTTAITPGGAAVTTPFTTPGQNGALTFTGTAGQRISLKVTSTVTRTALSIIAPDSSNLVTPLQVTTAGTYIDTTVLPATGTYTIPLDPASSYTGSMTFTLYNVPPDVSSTITPGGAAVTTSITTPGQNGALTFNGTAGQRISLKATSTITRTTLSIIAPDSSNLVTPVQVTTAGAFIDATALPVTGTYTIVLDPTTTSTGSVTLTLYNVAPDLSTTITPGGAPVTATITTPGQNAALTFSGTAGQRISLKVASTITQTKLSIVNPDASNLITPMTLLTSGTYIDAKALPATGTYTILLDPASTYTGSVTLTLYNVPPDISTTITPGGAAVTTAVTTPGQNAALTFNGTAGQRVSLLLSNVTIGSAYIAGAQVSVLKPDGTALIPATGFTTLGRFLDVQTLPVSGVYKIVLDPSGANTGSVTWTLYNVPADVSATITRGGAAVTVTTTTPGQNAQVTFSGVAAGTSVSLAVSDGIGTTKVSILNPDGTVLVDPTTVSTITTTLPTAGTYTILVDPGNQSTGSVTLTLT